MATEQIGESTPVSSLDLREARALVAHLFTPTISRYYAELILSTLLGWTCYIIGLSYPLLTTTNSIFVVLGALCFFRALNLIHPIFHLPPAARDKLRCAYDLLFGIPLLAPYFLYERSHAAHHKLSIYGTLHDPEYIRFSKIDRKVILGFVGLNVLLPPALYLRFSLGTLLSYLHPSLRARALVSLSSFSVRRSFRRPLAEGREKRLLLIEEHIASAYALGLLVATCFSLVTPQLILQGLMIGILLALLNAAQFLTLHRYDGPEADLDAQILDTLNSPGKFGILSEIWAPVGQRFHALHHCFPALPYHNLPEAHRILTAHLSQRSIYHQSRNPSFYHAVSDLWLKPRP